MNLRLFILNKAKTTMKKTKLLAAIAATLLGLAEVKAQTQPWIRSTSSPYTISCSTSTDIVNIGTNTATSTNPSLYVISTPVDEYSNYVYSGINSKFLSYDNVNNTTKYSYVNLVDWEGAVNYLIRGVRNSGSGETKVFGIDNSGNVGFNGTLSTGGSSPQSGYNLTIGGNSYLNGNVTIPSPSTLSVGGTSTLTGAVGINTTPGAYQLAVTGTSNLSGNVTIPSPNTLSVGGTSTLTGAVGINTTPGTYQLAVTGTSNLNGSVTIPANTSGTSNLLVGLTAAPTNSPNYDNNIDPTTYNSQYTVAVAGNANFQGAVVIGGSPAYFTQTTLPNGPWANTNFYSLFVAGGVLTEQVQVALSNSSYWADFVFDKNYKLTPLAELESFIQKNHHLPEIPSAEEVVKSGINVAEMDSKLLQKIEELTLYVIEIEKNSKKIQKENQELKERVSKLEVK